MHYNPLGEDGDMTVKDLLDEYSDARQLRNAGQVQCDLAGALMSLGECTFDDSVKYDVVLTLIEAIAYFDHSRRVESTLTMSTNEETTHPEWSDEPLTYDVRSISLTSHKK